MQKRLLSLIATIIILAAAGAYFTRDVQMPFSTFNSTNVVKSAASSTKPAEQTTFTVSTTQTTVQTNALVVRVVDGDTLVAKLDAEPGKEYKIRLLGVNTPETVDPRRTVQCYGKQASDFSKHTLSDKRIRLDADPQADERDKYDRLLRNVILEDGTDFNAKLVSEGYAYAYLSFPLNPTRKAELRRLETEAKNAKRGLWGEETCNN